LEEEPDSMLEWLTERFPRIAPEAWRLRAREGLVTDDEGAPIDLEGPYRAHLRLSYFREVPDEPEPPPLRILFEDERLVAVDKPGFLPVTPGGPYVRRCVLYAAQRQLGLAGLAAPHRLDRETSGVVLLVKRPEDRGPYGKPFAEGTATKIYEALAAVSEAPAERRWSVASRIETGTPWFRRREVPGRPNAVSEIELLELRNGVGRFRLRPETGKTHQLRLHMLRIGFPILGDRFYPELRPQGPDDPSNPLRLVASSLAFRDPVTGEDRRFESRYDVRALAE
jgi:tRNA pseudouridine32 synthase/23S rRNA pseudouridine746 synthase